MDEKDIVIGIGIEKDGRVVLQTKEETIPTEIVQRVLDEVIGKIIHLNSDKVLNEALAEKTRECNIWRWIAILQLGIFIICILRAKGVI